MDLRTRLAAVNWTAAGLLAGAFGVGVLLGGLAGDGSTRHWLFAFSGSLEVFGVLLVASPEIAPLLQRVGRALVAAWERAKALWRSIGRLLRRKRHHRVDVAGGGRLGAVGGRATGRVSVPADATLEEKVEYLLRRDQDVQGRFDETGARLAALPGEWKADIAEASSELRAEHAAALEALRDRHLTVRLVGVALLVTGIALAMWGNLL